jgi:hypothetical protein
MEDVGMRDDQRQFESRDAGRRFAGEVEKPQAAPMQPYVDPAAEAMSHNPNLSPPIHPRRDKQ